MNPDQLREIIMTPILSDQWIKDFLNDYTYVSLALIFMLNKLFKVNVSLNDIIKRITGK